VEDELSMEDWLLEYDDASPGAAGNYRAAMGINSYDALIVISLAVLGVVGYRCGLFTPATVPILLSRDG
jgi:hypothetical protein